MLNWDISVSRDKKQQRWWAVWMQTIFAEKKNVLHHYEGSVDETVMVEPKLSTLVG